LQKVIFDSSFLMAVVERPTTWFEDMVDDLGGFQPLLLECVERELRKISEGSGKRARTASVALALASKFGRAPCGAGTVDGEIVSAAVSAKAAVATTDKDLALTLRSAHVPVVKLRGSRVALG
jgi:rRNA-processing protein FCF1